MNLPLKLNDDVYDGIWLDREVVSNKLEFYVLNGDGKPLCHRYVNKETLHDVTCYFLNRIIDNMEYENIETKYARPIIEAWFKMIDILEQK